ncbi:ribonuclease Z [Magnaporthiopsis poae ATCC 64411]|uniref:ribonuclease Z n=1 Tax=Magnaporthiopsis poae (strain ATCC 64411 / 73-15) TaxID=644358 RepID=A0A0C4DTT3_MAGP6|nr:ribonuclease Z [Magnaporthiopsis poae ATCC 64411]
MSRRLEVILRGKGVPTVLKTSFPHTPCSNTLNRILGTEGGRKTRSAWRLPYHGPTVFRDQSVFLLTSRDAAQAGPSSADYVRSKNRNDIVESSDVDLRNMLVTTTLVSTPSADMRGTSVLLHFDNRRYLIGNVSEGTQRLMVQRGHSLAKMDEIMLTGPIGSKTCGGLLGMILTIAGIVDTTVKNRNYTTARPTARIGTMTSLKLRGSDNLIYYLALGRKFILRQSLPVVPREILTDPRLEDPTNTECDWEDDNIKVWHVPLVNTSADRRKRRKPSSEENEAGEADDAEEGMTDAARDALAAIVKDMFENQGLDALVEMMLHDVKLPAAVFVHGKDGKLERYPGPFPGPGRDVPDIPVLARRLWPSGLVQTLPKTRPDQTSMCYLIKPQPRRGKFDRAAADALGVPQTSFKLLCAGQNATAKDGTTVTPDMVLGARVEGTSFGVFEVPNHTYIPALLARPEWEIEDIVKNLGLIYWTLGAGVIEDSTFLSFLKGKLSGVKHIVSSPETSSDIVNFRNSASMAITHNKLDPASFPPIHLAQPSTPNTSELPYTAGKPGITVRLSPELQVDDHGVGPMNTEEAWDRIQNDEFSQKVLAKVAEWCRWARARRTRPSTATCRGR